ncbi:hypothetical protein B7P43_G05310 [Cryptotermes secundus]|uniref:Uncharacterized protein n=1 Tax=Cryptotermes secundus TaxID=105785 RepID=A0A2J7QF92_9NEOP|nr:hypothetical protein B7P43_G05310 [Cryptotermes secundus]
MNIVLGAPRHSAELEAPEASAALLSRLRRASGPEDMSRSLSGILDAPQEPHKRSLTLQDEAVQLENLLKEEGNFEPRQNGGSFSPVRNYENGNKISSLPAFRRIPSLSNNCPTCVPDSFRWRDMD